MASRLDDLAVKLAEPISRRRAIRLAGAAAFAGAFSLRQAPPALADCPSCPRSSDPPSYSQRCSVTRGVGCIFVCCPETFACCTTSEGVVCCREGYRCGPVRNNQPTCECIESCGGNCCAPGEKCTNADTGLCCQIGCGDTCCQAGEKCVDPKRGVCCKDYEKGCPGKHQTVCCDSFYGQCCAGTVVTQCCGRGQRCQSNGACVCKPGHPIPCNGDDCCTAAQKCCTGIGGTGFCIRKQWECCGDTFALENEECCAGRFPFNPSFQRCCGIAGVCPRNSECCPDGCCPEGTNCCQNGCCTTSGAHVSPRQPFVAARDRRRALRGREARPRGDR